MLERAVRFTSISAIICLLSLFPGWMLQDSAVWNILPGVALLWVIAGISNRQRRAIGIAIAVLLAVALSDLVSLSDLILTPERVLASGHPLSPGPRAGMIAWHAVDAAWMLVNSWLLVRCWPASTAPPGPTSTTPNPT